MPRFTKEQVEEFRKVYPNGHRAVMYLAIPKKGDEYDPQYYGTIVGINREGVHVEWEEDGQGTPLRKAFVTSSIPGVDRFELVTDLPPGVSLTSLKVS